MADALAWSFVAAVVYSYFGYPALLFLLAKGGRRSPALATDDLPPVTVLIAAHNEEAVIEGAVRSVLASDYPRDLLSVVVASDASDDRTDLLIRNLGEERVRLVRLESRSGKRAALQAALQGCETPIVAFADASSFLHPDAIRILVAHFAMDGVGSVVGSRAVVDSGGAVSRGDGLYWRYEAALRTFESRSGSSCVGVEGGLFAVRRDALDLGFPDAIALDYAICCEVHKRGFTNVYEPNAVFDERAAATVEAEFRRKVRVIVRGIRGFFWYWRLLNPLRHPRFSFQNLSHRLSRWLVPFFLLGLLLATGASDDLLMSGLFWAQVGFYALAAIGSVIPSSIAVPWIFSVPTYFTTVNLAALVSWLLALRRYEIWQPPPRA